MRDFGAFEEYMSEQAEYRAGAYTECLGNIKKALRAKRMDLAFLVITEMRIPFDSSNAPDGFQTTIAQYSLPYLSLHYLFHLSLLILITTIHHFQLIGQAYIRPIELISIFYYSVISPCTLSSLLLLILPFLGSKWLG